MFASAFLEYEVAVSIFYLPSCQAFKKYVCVCISWLICRAGSLVIKQETYLAA